MKTLFKICLFFALVAKKIMADNNITKLTPEPGLNSFINNYLPIKTDDHLTKNTNNSGLEIFSPSTVTSSDEINFSTRSDNRISSQLAKIFDSDNFLIYFHLTWGK